MSNREKAAAHAAKAEELLDEAEDMKRLPRMTYRAAAAGAHATLAVYYRDLPE